jgi:hypothetical protein
LQKEVVFAMDNEFTKIEFTLEFEGSVTRFRKLINGLNEELRADDPFAETCYQHLVIDDEHLSLSMIDLRTDEPCGNVTVLSLPKGRARLEVWHYDTAIARQVWERLYAELVAQGFVETTPTQDGESGAGGADGADESKLPPITDHTDKRIWKWVRDDPDLLDQEIAQRLNISRQAVNARRNKLKAMGYRVR